jgi:hypothetical protein
MDDDKVEEINGQAQNVGFSHDPRKENEKADKKERPDEYCFASEELDVLVVRPFDIHSSHLEFIDSAPLFWLPDFR